jgi:hypothetical protein
VNFAIVVSLVLAILAVLGVFIEIPIVSDFAFWVAVGAYILLAGNYRRRHDVVDHAIDDLDPVDDATSFHRRANGLPQSADILGAAPADSLTRTALNHDASAVLIICARSEPR